MTANWIKRFLVSTRGQILSLLRKGARTVNELADATRLTDNAIRVHLKTLERDGLVEQTGSRPGSRKPNLVYALAPGAEEVFPKAYGPLLQQVLSVLSDTLSPEALDALLRTVARRVAARYRQATPDEDIRGRVRYALDVIEELGGLADVEESAEGLLIHGFDCPLAAVLENRAACRLAETLLSELVGCPVTERCKVEDTVQCRFQVRLDEARKESTRNEDAA